MLSFILKPLFITLLLFGVFCIVWLRSNVMMLEYNLGELEKKKIESLKGREMLRAEKASLLSFERVNAFLSRNEGFVFPDRTRVIYVKRQKGSQPYNASPKQGQLAEP